MLTIPLWGPPVFDREAEKALRRVGFSEIELSLQEIGFSQLSLNMNRLRYHGVTLSDGELTLGYHLKGLWKKELDQVTVAHPKVAIDLTQSWPVSEDSAEPNEPSILEHWPERFPIGDIPLHDATLLLQGSDWARSVELNGQLSGRERLRGQASLNSQGLKMNAEADLDWSDLSGSVTASAQVDALAELAEIGRKLGGLTLPEGLDWTAQSTELGTEVGFAEQKLRDWNLTLKNKGATLRKEHSRISFEELNLNAEGEGVELGPFDMDVNRGNAGYKALTLSFDQLSAKANGAEQIGLDLSGWELSGKSGMEELGTISASADELELSVAGGWQPWRPGFSVANLGLKLRVKKGPLSLFTGLGSVSGTWQMEAEVSSDEARTISLSMQLEDASVTAPGASLERATLSLSVDGVLPDSLGASASVSEGRVTWSDREGSLSGLKGSFELATLLPLASKGQQTLQFASIEQGEFKTGAGELQLSYISQRKEGPPLKLEITTTALGGKIRILVDGSLIDSPSLSIRVFLDSVQLDQLAALFPQFEGQIEGAATGELALRLKEGEIHLLPGELQLVDDTTGRFAYLQQGWLTQDPDLDPEAFVSERDIMEIMKDSQGAPALTELAMRDLKMSYFQLKIEEAETGEQTVVAQIKGNRSIKGVNVPVVLDVPIRGDVKETINAVFEFHSRM